MALPGAVQALELRADSARLEWGEDRHLLLYEGRVHCVDEGLELRAEKLSLRSRADAVTEVASAVAIGVPAHFHHTPKGGGPVVRGYAQRIEYHPSQQRIVLHGGARLRRGGRLVEGEHIDYHLQAPAQDTTP